MTEATPCGMAWGEIAAHAYAAYAASTGGKNFRGDPMPAFGDLPAAIRVAWEAAVRHAGDCLAVKVGGTPPDERHWGGWLPPR